MQPAITPDRLRRFDEKTVPEPNSGCVLWLGGANEHGYGVFWNGERLEKAHRFALRASGCCVPPEMDVLHCCDTPACVEPQHLRVGTTLENVSDMWSRRRATVQHRRGTSQTQAKLDDDKAQMIRVMYAFGEGTQYDLADKFGVSQRTIWGVLNALTWRKPSGLTIERGRGR